ncbi:MAG: nucleotide pyrophosphohydrolase [Desulfurivibrionaceae bacterium]
MKEIQEILNRLLRFRDERDWAQFHTAKNLALSISLESAELLEFFQWTTEDQDIPPEKIDHLSDEIADIFIYLLLMSHKLGVDPLQAAEEKIKKNEEKYPAELVKGKSFKYDEY